MIKAALKNKRNKSLEEMDAQQLEAAYFLLNELVNQQKLSMHFFDKVDVDTKISEGIKQLNNGEGTDFRSFLNEMQVSYGKSQKTA